MATIRLFTIFFSGSLTMLVYYLYDYYMGFIDSLMKLFGSSDQPAAQAADQPTADANQDAPVVEETPAEPMAEMPAVEEAPVVEQPVAEEMPAVEETPVVDTPTESMPTEETPAE